MIAGCRFGSQSQCHREEVQATIIFFGPDILSTLKYTSADLKISLHTRIHLKIIP